MSTTKIYQLKVSLKRIKPLIWRRILVESNTSLTDLHKIIQTSMGWTNSHLHQFIDGDAFYAEPSPYDDDDEMLNTKDYRKIKVNRLLKNAKDHFIYEYDFGDGWEHKVVLEKIIERTEEEKYPCCKAGKNACPPEDCGGTWGYMSLMEIMMDPTHEEHEEMKEWLGGSFDPISIDIDYINGALQGDNFGLFSPFDS